MREPETPTDAIAALSRRIRKLEAERQACHDPVQRQSLGVELFALKAEQFRLWKARERAGR